MKILHLQQPCPSDSILVNGDCECLPCKQELCDNGVRFESRPGHCCDCKDPVNYISCDVGGKKSRAKCYSSIVFSIKKLDRFMFFISNYELALSFSIKISISCIFSIKLASFFGFLQSKYCVLGAFSIKISTVLCCFSFYENIDRCVFLKECNNNNFFCPRYSTPTQLNVDRKLFHMQLLQWIKILQAIT